MREVFQITPEVCVEAYLKSSMESNELEFIEYHAELLKYAPPNYMIASLEEVLPILRTALKNLQPRLVH